MLGTSDLDLRFLTSVLCSHASSPLSSKKPNLRPLVPLAVVRGLELPVLPSPHRSTVRLQGLHLLGEATGANPVGELNVHMRVQIAVDVVPVLFVVPNLLALATNRQQAPQGQQLSDIFEEEQHLRSLGVRQRCRAD